MSKNYELLQQIGLGFAAGRRSASAEQSAASDYVASVSSEVLASLAPAVREETLKLVQRLFLTPEQVAPKSVLFVPVDAEASCNWLCSVVAKVLAKSVAASVCLVE